MGKRNLWELSAIASVCMMLAACGGGSGGDDSTGSLSLSVTDAPAPDDAKVCIHFTGITLHHSDGDLISIPFDPSTYVDDTDACIDNVPSDAMSPDDPANNAVNLSELQGVLSVALADSIDVKAGFYNWIRLDVDESLSYVMDSSGQNDLSCPSCDGEQSGLKLNRGITVPAGGVADFMIDIDLAKSLKKSGDYKLRPTLRLVNLVETGKIKGVVDVSLIANPGSSETGCSVYVYAEHDVIPDDYHEADTVLTSTKVVYDMDSGLYEYTAAEKSALYLTVAELVDTERERMRAMGLRAPSTAEYLDAIRACLELSLKPGADFWENLRDIVVTKQTQVAEI